MNRNSDIDEFLFFYKKIICRLNVICHDIHYLVYDTNRVMNVAKRFFWNWLVFDKFVSEIRKENLNMRKSYIKVLFNGIVLVSLFVFWTCFIQFYDVQLHESTNSMVGFASLNFWFHQLTEAHYLLYELTDYLGLVPIVICIYWTNTLWRVWAFL